MVTLFLALSSTPWWTLAGATTNKLLNIQVSPFYLQTNLVGSVTNAPFTTALGSFTRLLLILGFIALAACSIRPLAWWHQLAVYVGLTSLAEIYFSFLLMYHNVETIFLGKYGVLPPYSGTSHLQASILGLDLNYYSSPLVTASFGLPFYLGFLSFGLVGGRIILKSLQDRRRKPERRGVHAIFTSEDDNVSNGIHEVYMSPPYQHVWLSSDDKGLNPLGTDPERLTDDQLLLSFDKLYKAVEPGGNVDIILPSWATRVGDRFQKLAPYVGFTIEKSAIIYRTEGKPETEIRFGKPIPQITPTANSSVENLPNGEIGQIAPPNPMLSGGTVEPEQHPVQDTSAEPAWVPVRMTRLERSILKSAVNVINARRESVPYRELLNQVYLDLVDKNVNFDSARQIETTLLDHSGRELIIVEEEDGTNGLLTRKWSLGERKIVPEKQSSLPFLRVISRRARPKLTAVHRLLKKWQRKPGYRRKRKADEE